MQQSIAPGLVNGSQENGSGKPQHVQAIMGLRIEHYFLGVTMIRKKLQQNMRICGKVIFLGKTQL
jgi:hypothetical protein